MILLLYSLKPCAKNRETDKKTLCFCQSNFGICGLLYSFEKIEKQTRKPPLSKPSVSEFLGYFSFLEMIKEKE
jgi:hypothetical protein